MGEGVVTRAQSRKWSNDCLISDTRHFSLDCQSRKRGSAPFHCLSRSRVQDESPEPRHSHSGAGAAAIYGDRGAPFSGRALLLIGALRREKRISHGVLFRKKTLRLLLFLSACLSPCPRGHLFESRALLWRSFQFRPRRQHRMRLYYVFLDSLGKNARRENNHELLRSNKRTPS